MQKWGTHFLSARIVPPSDLKERPSAMRYILFFVVLLLIANCAAATEIVPLMMAENLSADGVSEPVQPQIAALLKYVEDDQALHFDIKRYPFKRLMQNLQNGEQLAFGLSYTKDRAQYLQFSLPIYGNYVWLVTRSDARFAFSRIQDLKGKSIGVIAGSSYGDEFDQQKDVLFKVENDPHSGIARLKKILLKRMDATLISSIYDHAAPLERALNEQARLHMPELLENGRVQLAVLPVPLLIDDIHFAIARAHDHGIIDRINRAIEHGKKNGKIRQLLEDSK
jgi:polar amino acid transport system substrate-binding protein